MIPKDIESYYRFHSKFYDLTRWAFLFGRNSLKTHFPELPEHARILDLGCGTGKHLEQLRLFYSKADIIGIDLSTDMLRLVNRSIVDSVGLINEKYSPDSFQKNSFDLILCSYSLTMFEDIDEAIQNIKAHLKPSGTLLVVDFDSTPFTWFRKWMKKNHVSLDPNLFELLNRYFDVEFKETRKAYFGLYSYSVFCGIQSNTVIANLPLPAGRRSELIS